MTASESELLDRSLAIYDSSLPVSLWTQIASLHLGRPVSVKEFQAWREGYVKRYPRMLAQALNVLDRQG
jgi:hypothetical protein